MLRTPFIPVNTSTPAKGEGWGEGAGFLPQAEGWEKVLLKNGREGKSSRGEVGME